MSTSRIRADETSILSFTILMNINTRGKYKRQIAPSGMFLMQVLAIQNDIPWIR
jgi:hypothetical protein